MSTFAAAFREIVMPDLRRRCRISALMVARERWSFTEASSHTFDLARARGAAHLPDGVLTDLHGWIDSTLLRTIADIETRPDAAREIVDEDLGAAWPKMT